MAQVSLPAQSEGSGFYQYLWRKLLRFSFAPTGSGFGGPEFPEHSCWRRGQGVQSSSDHGELGAKVGRENLAGGGGHKGVEEVRT